MNCFFFRYFVPLFHIERTLPFVCSAQAGPITCGKPTLRSIVPSLCTVHFQKAQKHLTRTFKRTGLNISSTSKMAPKFHVLVTEYVHHIQVKRRKELKGNESKIVVQNQK